MVEFSMSPWASPIVIALKKQVGIIRMCVDFRGVNARIKLMLHPMPQMECLLSCYHGMR